MRNLFLIFTILFFCSQDILLGQAQVALVSDNATGRIIGPLLQVEILSIKAIGEDDCDQQMQFSGTVKMDLGENLGNLNYRFESQPTNHLTFGKEGYLTSRGAAFGQQVDVLFSVFDKDKAACKSLQDIVDINSQSNDNVLKIRIEENKVWLLNGQNQKIRELGNVGQVITIRGNNYVNNNVNNTRNSNYSTSRSRSTNQRNKHFNPNNNTDVNTNNVGMPDVEVAEFKFVVKILTRDNPSPYTIPHQNLPTKATKIK
ncbi:MAG: hypothetical protein R3E32_17395 [Chitinophagales bacterium]